ncbi:MAG TPA: TonB-dependent receptor [Gemmatimonadaceae bacterium]
MRCTLNVVLGLLFLASAAAVSAQAPSGPAGPPQQAPPGGEVQGLVMDKDQNTPVAKASIAVRNKANGALVAGAVSREDGKFRVQGLRPGTYYLRVTSLGYGPISSDEFQVSPAAAAVNVGAIQLSKVAIALSDVEVKAERDVVTVEPDRNTYKAKDVAATANNASQVLENVPSVAVDGDGKVSLRGNENVVVQINGRPAPMTGAQLGNYLKQLPSAVIDRVEVIPTPSARQDPEGMAGIINLVLKQNVDLGMSGGFTVASATASGRYNGNGNIGYQVGPWTTFSSYGYNADDRDITGVNDRIRLLSTGLPSAYTEQDILGNQKNWGHNFTTTVDYKVNTRDVLTNALTLNLRGFNDNSVATYSELNSTRTLLDYYNRARNTDVNSWMADYYVALKRTFEARKHELNGEIRYNANHDDDETDQWRLSLGAPGLTASSASALPIDREIAKTDALNQSLNAQIDYMKMLNPKTKLETGWKGTGRFIDRDYDVRKDALGNGQFVNSSLSNALDFTEMVQAGYGVLSRNVNKWDLQAGLRAEYARRDFTLKNNNESFPYDYFSVYPSAIANYKFNDGLTSKIAYSRRVRRPGTQELNPFPQFFDPQNVFFGNPKLNPEYTDAFELGLVRTGKYGMFQVSPFFRHTTDIIRVNINTADTFEGRDVTSISFSNLEKSDSWGTDVNGQLRLGPLGNILAGFNVFKMVTDGGSQSVLSSNAVMWRTNVNATLNFGKNRNTTFQGSYFYRGPQTIERGKFSAQQMANFSLRQKIMEGKATVAFRVQDPFNTMGMKIRTGDDNITQLTQRKFGVRAAFLTFQYNWGQTPKIRQPQQQQEQQGQSGFPGG